MMVLKEKQKMTPLIAPCEPPYSAGVTDDLAALMPPGTPPIAPDVCSTPEHCRRANASC
jgi:hypothetical protein